MPKEYVIEPGQRFEVDLFCPEDADGVVQLFKSVYGEGYPVRTFLEAERLIEENASGRTISSVARTSGGDIVGHNALFNSAAHPGTYESGAGAVHALYRGGHGIFTQMVNHGLHIAASFPHVHAAFGEAVCNHVFSQRLMEKTGFAPRALEVDLMPAAAYEKEASAFGRVAAILSFHTFRPRPHAIYIPDLYRDVFPFFYEDFDDKREFLPADPDFSTKKPSDIRVQIFPSAGVARVAVHEQGTDFAARVRQMEKAFCEQDIQVIQVWLRLSCPGAGEATKTLKTQGFFLGGILPRWFDDDGLLMQKILKTPDWDEIQVHGERAARILAIVKADSENGHGFPEKIVPVDF